jgi:sortase A
LLQQRAQRQLFNQFKVATDMAASAFGQSGVSPLPDTAPAYGSAVALLQIPKLGINQIVVEGTSSSNTQAGPGHVPGTVLPGQAGESDIIGRRTTFGAPFYQLGSLKVGDTINVTTVEGPAVYKVIPAKLATTSNNILKLITSSPPIIATGSTSIYATLTKNPYPITPKNARTSPASNQFALLVLLLEVLLLVLYVTRGIYRRFGTLVGWLILAPLVVGSVLALTLALDTLLPSTL